MKYLLLGVLASLTLAGAALAQDPIFGTWKTEPDDGKYSYIEMKQCGAVICGVAVKSFNESGEYASPVLGKQIVRNMKNDGDGQYSGEAWRPSNDKVYVGKATLNGDTLRMKGCVLGGLICFGQNWTRVN
ncbi:DUF2147 domain-containing protein [Seohaeicola nanhaiensis]|uniref:DUF2147 domain-containing protein n=1 Tax=Seohaeicola nanhaiensis TaxID=1387282 RepID=A0ABV9KJ66_9RHOB